MNNLFESDFDKIFYKYFYKRLQEEEVGHYWTKYSILNTGLNTEKPLN
jgi:hypothetical protein